MMSYHNILSIPAHYSIPPANLFTNSTRIQSTKTDSKHHICSTAVSLPGTYKPKLITIRLLVRSNRSTIVPSPIRVRSLLTMPYQIVKRLVFLINFCTHAATIRPAFLSNECPCNNTLILSLTDNAL